MSTVGQIEKKTQQRVVKLFRDTLGYDYLGDWTDREGNRNIEAGVAARLSARSRATTRRSSRGRCTCSTRRRVTRARASTTATARSTTCCATA